MICEQYVLWLQFYFQWKVYVYLIINVKTGQYDEIHNLIVTCNIMLLKYALLNSTLIN